MILSKINRFWPFIVLAVLAFIVHLAFLSHPAQVVFDEVHFGKFVGAYFTGQYYFDIHPPLGKLMIAGWAKLNGVNPNFDFDHIGEQAAPQMLFTLRFLPAFFGGLFVLAFSWLAWLISRSKKTALIAGVLILLDNAFLVQSHFILVDIFMLTFEVLALCFFFLQQRQKSFGAKWFFYLILTSLFFSLAISIKWTGLTTIGIIGVVLVAKIFSQKLTNYLNNSIPVIPTKACLPDRQTGIQTPESRIPEANASHCDGAGKSGMPKWMLVKETSIDLIFLLVIGFAVYAIPYAIHFKLVPESGPGDAFMSSAWQQELKYGRDNIYQPLSFFQKFFELNKTMLSANAGITAEHPYGSRWYSWPIDRKPIYYWTDGQPPSGKSANIYFVGNPVLWWLTLAFVALTLILITDKKSRRRVKPIFYILLLAYFANLLPFILIKRISFLYHYLPAMTFGILLTALYLAQIYQKKKIFVAIFIFILAGFLVLTPYSYGLPISNWLNKLEINLIGLLA